MEPWLFWIFAAGLLGGALSVVLNRGPVAAALSLVVSMIFLAALFVLLHAFFLAAVQVLVYAGAVMVLFLFIIMLLDLKALPPGRRRWLLRAGAFLVAGALAFLLTQVLAELPQPPPLPAETEVAAVPVSDVREVGELLFTRYLLPFEITGLLLLVAMIGVVVVSKKESVEPKAPLSS